MSTGVLTIFSIEDIHESALPFQRLEAALSGYPKLPFQLMSVAVGAARGRPIRRELLLYLQVVTPSGSLCTSRPRLPVQEYA
jgi:hypothetical protein